MVGIFNSCHVEGMRSLRWNEIAKKGSTKKIKITVTWPNGEFTRDVKIKSFKEIDDVGIGGIYRTPQKIVAIDGLIDKSNGDLNERVHIEFIANSATSGYTMTEFRIDDGSNQIGDVVKVKKGKRMKDFSWRVKFMNTKVDVRTLVGAEIPIDDIAALRRLFKVRTRDEENNSIIYAEGMTQDPVTCSLRMTGFTETKYNHLFTGSAVCILRQVKYCLDDDRIIIKAECAHMTSKDGEYVTVLIHRNKVDKGLKKMEVTTKFWGSGAPDVTDVYDDLCEQTNCQLNIKHT